VEVPAAFTPVAFDADIEEDDVLSADTDMEVLADIVVVDLGDGEEDDIMNADCNANKTADIAKVKLTGAASTMENDDGDITLAGSV